MSFIVKYQQPFLCQIAHNGTRKIVEETGAALYRNAFTRLIGESAKISILFTAFVGILATSQVACNAKEVSNVATAPISRNASIALDVSKYVSERGWKLAKTKALALPVSDIAPVVYTAPGHYAPSCGLLTRTSSHTEFFEILSPEKGAGFPQCLAIDDVAAFELHKRQYLVFEYLNRDTKEDVYRQYFYVYRDAAGRYVADKELNESPAWAASVVASSDKVNRPLAKEGIRRARGTVLAKTVPGMRFLERDFIAEQTSAFASFHDKASNKCAFVVDSGSKPITFGHDLFASGDTCLEVLATSKLERAGITYFLALFRGKTRNHLTAVSVAANGAVAAETRAALAAEKASPLVNMKATKAALQSAL